MLYGPCGQMALSQIPVLAEPWFLYIYSNRNVINYYYYLSSAIASLMTKSELLKERSPSIAESQGWVMARIVQLR